MFGEIKKLKKLFTTQNLQYLDVILSMLVKGGDAKYSNIYNSFWAEFGKHFPAGQNHANQAWSGLHQLLAVVHDQLGKK